MLRHMKVLATASVALLGVLGLAAAARAEGTPGCVHWWGQTVVMGRGYNHVVGVENRCARPVACVITTDVAPDPIQATVAPAERTELTTFRGSPAYAFRPHVECKLQ
jgi:hypothetical protein